MSKDQPQTSTLYPRFQSLERVRLNLSIPYKSTTFLIYQSPKSHAHEGQRDAGDTSLPRLHPKPGPTVLDGSFAEF